MSDGKITAARAAELWVEGKVVRPADCEDDDPDASFGNRPWLAEPPASNARGMEARFDFSKYGGQNQFSQAPRQSLMSTSDEAQLHQVLDRHGWRTWGAGSYATTYHHERHQGHRFFVGVNGWKHYDNRRNEVLSSGLDLQSALDYLRRYHGMTTEDAPVYGSERLAGKAPKEQPPASFYMPKTSSCTCKPNASATSIQQRCPMHPNEHYFAQRTPGRSGGGHYQYRSYCGCKRCTTTRQQRLGF